MMKTTEKEAIADVRRVLKLKRLDPRRLFIVDDGDSRWIGDRANLNAFRARVLRDIGAATEREYERTCDACTCLASSQGHSGRANFADLPESWRDGSALGPIAPL